MLMKNNNLLNVIFSQNNIYSIDVCTPLTNLPLSHYTNARGNAGCQISNSYHLKKK